MVLWRITTQRFFRKLPISSSHVQQIKKYLHGYHSEDEEGSSQINSHARISVDGAQKLKWDMPPMRLLKFNVDASCVNREDGEGYKVGVGGILRDYEGEMVLSVKASMLASIAHHAEAEFYAVQLALEVLLENNMNVLNTIIETDSEEVFMKLSSNPMILDSEFNSKHKIINKILAMRPTNTKLLVSHVKRQCNEIADKLAGDGVLLPEGEKVLYYNTLDMGDEYVKKIYDEKRGFLHTRRARTF